MNVNQFIGENLRKLSNMSITQLKALLGKLKRSFKPQDRESVKIIKSIIEKKKAEYPVYAAELALKRFRRLQPRVNHK